MKNIINKMHININEKEKVLAYTPGTLWSKPVDNEWLGSYDIPHLWGNTMSLTNQICCAWISTLMSEHKGMLCMRHMQKWSNKYNDITSKKKKKIIYSKFYSAVSQIFLFPIFQPVSFLMKETVKPWSKIVRID